MTISAGLMRGRMLSLLFHIVGVVLLIVGIASVVIANISIKDFSQENGKIQDVSLPFAGSKGVYGRVVFSSDVAGAHISCNEGKNFLSTKSGTVLGMLRWSTILGLVGGAFFLVVASISGRPRPMQDSHHTETSAQ